MDLARIAEQAVHVRGALQQPHELAGLLALVRPGDLVVEIGCDAGGVLWALCEVGAQVIGVDLHAAGFGTGRQLVAWDAQMLRGDSHQQSTKDRLLDLLAGRPVDLLFIDADHTYAGARKDWEMYGPLVRPGGVVALHDICYHADQPLVRVDRLWWEIKAKHPAATSEIVYHVRPWGTGMGIGVYTNRQQEET